MSVTVEDPVAEGHKELRAGEGKRVIHQMLSQPATVIACLGLVLLIVIAIFAPLLVPHDPNYADVMRRHQGISAAHWLGTDSIGRDVFSRILYGARTAVWTSTQSVALALLVGVPIGLLAGYLGGWADRIVMRATDIFQSIPSLIFAFALIAILGRGTNQTALAVAIVFAVILIRIARGLALREREYLYVDAAYVSGLTRSHILFREILPNVTGPIIVEAAIMLGSAILIITMLSFLGLGLDADVIDWGSMLDETRRYQAVHPYTALPPGLAIIFAVLMFNFAGDGLRDALAGKDSSSATKRIVRTKAPATQPPADPAAVDIQGLRVTFPGPDDTTLDILSDVSFSIRAGETLGLVGESGSGKSMTALSILGLVPKPGQMVEGDVWFAGHNLASLSDAELNRIRGSEIAMIFQDSIAGLSPVHRIGRQLAEPLMIHKGLSMSQAMDEVIRLLGLVGIPNAAERIHDYPHQFSGGMAQRASIAMALSCQPSVLIADEPTTALDVTIQAQVLDLLTDLQHDLSMSVLLITHDVGVVAETCDRVIVMYAGQVVEEGPVEDLLEKPRHPYTHALLTATPRHDERMETLPTVPGSVPPAWDWPTGCRFAPRCDFAEDQCRAAPVALENGVRCRRWRDLDLKLPT